MGNFEIFMVGFVKLRGIIPIGVLIQHLGYPLKMNVKLKIIE